MTEKLAFPVTGLPDAVISFHPHVVGTGLVRGVERYGGFALIIENDIRFPEQGRADIRFHVLGLFGAITGGVEFADLAVAGMGEVDNPLPLVVNDIARAAAGIYRNGPVGPLTAVHGGR